MFSRLNSRYSRRRFMQHLAMVGMTTSVASPFALATSSPNPFAPSEFELLPLGHIQPKGWLLSELQVQANGLSGHLDETWPDVGSNSGWLGGTGEAWERGPYFLDGLIPLAYLLNDDRLKAKSQRF